MAKETISQTEGLCKEVANCIRNAYDRGYKQGQKDMEQDTMAVLENGKMIGREEAWEYARKIIGDVVEPHFESAYMVDIFRCESSITAMTNNSAIEAITKIKEYEEKQKQTNEIKVGDEILIHNIQDVETYKAVVMDIDMDKGLWIFDENACNTVIEPNRYIGGEADIEVRKTGRHFDQIVEVLKQLKDENDGR